MHGHSNLGLLSNLALSIEQKSYRIVGPDIRPIENTLIPDDPTEIVERQRKKKIFVHFDTTTLQISEKETIF